MLMNVFSFHLEWWFLSLMDLMEWLECEQMWWFHGFPSIALQTDCCVSKLGEIKYDALSCVSDEEVEVTDGVVVGFYGIDELKFHLKKKKI